MTFKQTFALTASVIALWGGIARAQGVPGNVRSVQASVIAGTLTVQWTAVEGTAFYRIYFSHESILENEGNYDDFERTAGTETTYVFSNLPLSSPKIFIGVLAVNAAGMESEGFETEAVVSVATSQPAISSSLSSAMQSSQSASEQSTTAIPMTMKSAEAVSSTGVLVTFSKNLKSTAAFGPAHFLVTNLSGVVLPVRRIEVSGREVLVHTESQNPTSDYLVRLLDVIPADDGTNATPSEPQVRFAGYQTQGSASSASISSSRFSSVPQSQSSEPYGRNPNLSSSNGSEAPNAQLIDPTYLSLSAMPRKDGTYDVTARWGQVPAAEMYGLYTSRDGQMFARDTDVGNRETSAEYARIAPGMFGLRVTSKNETGETQGITKVIELPASGLGLLGIAGIAGAIAGRRLRRKKTDLVG